MVGTRVGADAAVGGPVGGVGDASCGITCVTGPQRGASDGTELDGETPAVSESAMYGQRPGAVGGPEPGARVALLREMADLPLLRTLTQPGWHVLCDDPMGAALRAAGLPEGCMSGVLEHGEFLSSSLSAGDATLVIATRRSERAVLGVLRRRKLRAMPLFGDLLPRLAAFAPGRLGPDAVRMSGRCARLSVLVMPAGAAPDRAAVRDGVQTVVPFGRAQVALARAQLDIGFDVQAWWATLVRARPGVDRMVLRVSPEQAGQFLAALVPTDATFVRQALADIPVEAADGADYAAYRAVVQAGSPSRGPAGAAVADVLRVHRALG